MESGGNQGFPGFGKRAGEQSFSPGRSQENTGGAAPSLLEGEGHADGLLDGDVLRTSQLRVLTAGSGSLRPPLLHGLAMHLGIGDTADHALGEGLDFGQIVQFEMDIVLGIIGHEMNDQDRKHALLGLLEGPLEAMLPNNGRRLGWITGTLIQGTVIQGRLEG